MAGNIQWSGYRTTETSVATTELDTITSGNVTALSAEIDNTSNKQPLADFELSLGSANVTSATAYVALFIVQTVDGTNYPDWTSGAYANYHGQYWVGNFLVKASNAAHTAHMRGVALPTGKFKIAFGNFTGVNTASSSNGCTMRDYADAYT